MQRGAILLIVAGLVWAGGCGKPTASNTPAPSKNTGGGGNVVVPPPPGTPSAPAANPAQPNPAAVGGPAPVVPNPNPEPEKKVAGVGVGKKGHYSRESVLGTIVATRWRVQEKLLFEAQIPQSLAVYKNTNPSGKGPKTHEEFMQKIIKDNGYQLPELPAGERYEYDPATEQLMVVSGEK